MYSYTIQKPESDHYYSQIFLIVTRALDYQTGAIILVMDISVEILFSTAYEIDAKFWIS
jgi:hypothetical protein